MERIVKYILVIFFAFLPCWFVQAEELSAQQLTTPANVAFSDCYKTYPIPAENLFYLTLDSISANRFEIKEMQSKMGYIVFKAAGKEFLAAIAYYGPNKSIVKITPVNGKYYFAPGIVINIFKYIDLNYNEPLSVINKS